MFDISKIFSSVFNLVSMAYDKKWHWLIFAGAVVLFLLGIGAFILRMLGK